MQISTAEQFRREVNVVLDKDRAFLCRRPDLVTLLMQGLMSLELQRAVDTLQGKAAEEILNSDQKLEALTYYQRWACAAAKRPRLAMDEPATEVADVVWVGDLTFTDLVKIWNETQQPRPEVAAAAEFHHEQSAGGAAGPDGAAVQREPVGAAAD